MLSDKSKRHKEDRASIFASFDALKGFREYLRQKERVIIPKRELSEDECDILDRKIHQLKIGEIVTVVYYDNGDYIKIEGVVSKIDLEISKTIMIVYRKINVSDIASIEFTHESID